MISEWFIGDEFTIPTLRGYTYRITDKSVEFGNTYSTPKIRYRLSYLNPPSSAGYMSDWRDIGWVGEVDTSEWIKIYKEIPYDPSQQGDTDEDI